MKARNLLNNISLLDVRRSGSRLRAGDENVDRLVEAEGFAPPGRGKMLQRRRRIARLQRSDPFFEALAERLEGRARGHRLFADNREDRNTNGLFLFLRAIPRPFH